MPPTSPPIVKLSTTAVIRETDGAMVWVVAGYVAAADTPKFIGVVDPPDEER